MLRLSIRERVDLEVYEQLHVGELEAEDVGHDQNSILGTAVFGVDLVCAD